MICPELKSCRFMQCVKKVAPYTSILIKAQFCADRMADCAKEQSHVILAIDHPTALDADSTVGVKVAEKVYFGGYWELRLSSD